MGTSVSFFSFPVISWINTLTCHEYEDRDAHRWISTWVIYSVSLRMLRFRARKKMNLDVWIWRLPVLLRGRAEGLFRLLSGFMVQFIMADTRYPHANEHRWLASRHILLCCVWYLRYEQGFNLWKGCHWYIYIDPTKIVADSITNNQPIVFVSINYRLNIFSFGDGKEKNLALKDQRLGIDWVRRNIASFGGDPVSFP